MGTCKSVIRKVLFVFEDELTHCYVAVDAIGDCPIGVQGWHHKVFPASMNAVQIMQSREFYDHVLWGLEAPL
jgi:hypothetical protein